jgi:hypothetical protein
MSYSYRTYVGPYVQCSVKIVETTETRRACINPTCRGRNRPAATAFCADCGSLIGDAPYTMRRAAVDTWDITEATNEALTGPGGDAYLIWAEQNGAHLWMANQDIPGMRDFWLEEYESFNLVQVSPDLVRIELYTFTAYFAATITALQNAYGGNNVAIHWGIVQDYL